MNDKIFAAIQETLPQMQVEAIRNALDELDTLRIENKQLTKLTDKHEKVCDEYNAKIEKLTNQLLVALTDADGLTDKLKKMTDERDTYKEQAQTAKIVTLQAALDATNGTMDKFLKNVIVREKLQHQVADENSGQTSSYVNGSQQMAPYSNKIHRQVEDTKETEAE